LDEALKQQQKNRIYLRGLNLVKLFL